MANALILTAPAAMSAPLAGTPILRLPGDAITLTSDTFTGATATTLAGRYTDAGMGGSALPYQLMVADSYGIKNGTLVPGAGNLASAALVELAPRPRDLTASIRIRALDTAAGSTPSNYLQIRRSTVASPQSQIRVAFSAGNASLYTATALVPELVAGSVTPITAGDVIAIREYDGLVEMYKNGVLMKSAKFASGTFPGAYAGIASAAGASFALDDFKITETIH